MPTVTSTAGLYVHFDRLLLAESGPWGQVAFGQRQTLARAVSASRLPYPAPTPFTTPNAIILPSLSSKKREPAAARTGALSCRVRSPLSPGLKVWVDDTRPWLTWPFIQTVTGLSFCSAKVQFDSSGVTR